MTTEETQSEVSMLSLSPRDVQCVAVLIEMCASLLSSLSREADVQGNFETLECLIDEHYSEAEYDALRQRTWALLSKDTALYFIDPRLPRVTGSTVLQ